MTYSFLKKKKVSFLVMITLYGDMRFYIFKKKLKLGRQIGI